MWLERPTDLVGLGVGLDLGDRDTSILVGVDVDHLCESVHDLDTRRDELTLELARPENL